MEVSKIGNPVYPQLLGRVVIINANLAFRTIFRAIKPLIPRTTIDKQTICPAAGTSRATANINQCPFVRKMKAVHQLPQFLGGALDIHPDFQEPFERSNAIVQYKVPSSRAFTIVEKDVTAANCSAHLELLLLTSGNLSLDVICNEDILEGPFTLAAKDGLVKKHFTLPSPGKFSLIAANKSRYNRIIEVALTIEEN